MKKHYGFVRCVLKLWGSANWYKGVDEPTFYQRIYKWRLPFFTACKVAKQIWLKN